MKVYVLLAYDEDYYIFESFLGVFRTREAANNFIKSDCWFNCDGEKVPKHEEYQIIEKEI